MNYIKWFESFLPDLIKSIDPHIYHSLYADTIPINNLSQIKSYLKSKGFVQKESGLCAPPWSMYFSTCQVNERGSSSNDYRTPNIIYITLSESTSSDAIKKYIYGISIMETTDIYLVHIKAQSGRRYNDGNIKSGFYVCEKEIDIIFKHFEKNIKLS